MPDFEQPDDIPGDYELSDREVLDRIRLMDRKMRKFREGDRLQSDRYLDANVGTASASQDWNDDGEWNDEAEDDTPDFVPIGQPNYLATNNEIKIAAISMGTPVLHIKANEDPQNEGVEGAGEVVAEMWDTDWKRGNWKRETQAALQKLGICGLGAIWMRWDTEYGPCLEHVPSKRLLIDPHATNLSRLDYGAVKIWMSIRKAKKLYDKEGEESAFEGEEGWAKEGKNLDNQRRGIVIYFDRDSERHCYNDKVLFKDKNLYGRPVPLFFIEGYNDPRDKTLPLGDNVFASGLNQQIVDLAAQASNAAKHGQQMTVGDLNYFDVPTQQAIKEGKPQQVLWVKKQLNPQALPLVRLPAEQLSDAWVEARREAQVALDSIQGVTQAARGQSQPNVTATQSVMVENKAGARPTQARADYETWITEIADFYVQMYQQFGGPTESDPGTSQTRHIWQCFKAVLKVGVVEGSASFDPPAANQQGAMQFYTTVVTSYQSWLMAHQAGLVDMLPNLKAVFKHLCRAFIKTESEQFLVPAPPAPQQPQGPPPELLKFLEGIYADAPPDVRRAIEESAGLPPSQVGDMPEEEADTGKTPEELGHEMRKQNDQQMHEAAMQAVEHQHETEIKKMDLWGKIKAAAMKPKPAPAAKTGGKKK